MVDDDDARGANLLGAFAVAAHDRLLAELAEHGGGSASRAAALATLKGCPGDTVEQLAAVLGLTGSGATRLVAGLVGDDLVDKRPGADGRALALHLTSRGQAVAEEILRARHDCFEEMLGELTPDERRTFVRLSERMLASLGDGAKWADHACRLCDYDSCPQQTCPVARKAAAS
ncbi:MarR family winged helix-turn-helix transcriptional regulator [Actinacidiphila sp. ITFR-21]|uniref:MarR family winged helix-turn-helix transcriptional regulator n=1 Tax=Actinacidiphila sp. ITFR-21 TaxID=3075199 RepID=UPI00288BCEB6|nr:MarR family winged helix-turn-helix transcriptional regulator [Streptomyces sp. ITFR-21]WNI16819.1 MarR family winged helix-turn-helix transcriptional regulator [Streptomyces sp. ITFR-21]